MDKESDSIVKYFSVPNLFGKIGKYAKVAGKEIVEKVLILYYCWQDPDTPAQQKAIIVGALAYFILPLDAIPDGIPGLGYTDDLGILAAAFAAVAISIKAEHKEKAREKIKEWFE